MSAVPKTYQVLLIEEDPKQTEIYADLIREVGHCKVDVLSQLKDSFEWIARSNYHLVVIDASIREGQKENQISESKVSGLAVLEQVKRISPMTSVILISEQATVEQAVGAIRLGAEDYLKKPFNIEAFQLAVKRGLDRKTVLEENTGASSFINLLNSCQMISASLEQKKIFGVIESYLSRELKSDYSAIYSLQSGESIRVDDLKHESHQRRAMQEILDIALKATNPLPKMMEGNEYYRFIERGQLTPGIFIFRFRCTGKSDYFCACLSPERPAVLDSFESRLKMLKSQIEVTGKNIEHYLGVQHLVYVDDATGLYNTRYLNYILDREIAQSIATKKSFALLFIDADKFKNINDTHGHLVGTKLLFELGAQLKKFVREKDTLFRYGGDEFVAVLSPCDLSTAKVVAERIRHSIEQHHFLESESLNLRFTVSIGVALFPDHAKTKKEVIEAADKAMYGAKKGNRNDVTVAPLTAATTLPRKSSGGSNG